MNTPTPLAPTTFPSSHVPPESVYLPEDPAALPMEMPPNPRIVVVPVTVPADWSNVPPYWVMTPLTFVPVAASPRVRMAFGANDKTESAPVSVYDPSAVDCEPRTMPW